MCLIGGLSCGFQSHSVGAFALAGEFGDLRVVNVANALRESEELPRWKLSVVILA